MERDGDEQARVANEERTPERARGKGVVWCQSWDQMQFERDRANGWGGLVWFVLDPHICSDDTWPCSHFQIHKSSVL